MLESPEDGGGVMSSGTLGKKKKEVGERRADEKVGREEMA